MSQSMEKGFNVFHHHASAATAAHMVMAKAHQAVSKRRLASIAKGNLIAAREEMDVLIRRLDLIIDNQAEPDAPRIVAVNSNRPVINEPTDPAA